MKRICLSFLIITLGGSMAFAQTQADQKVGMTGADFLTIPVGARAAALGESFVALVDDASAVFWNPAALSHQEGSGIFASVTQWPADIMFSAAAVTFQAKGVGNIGLFYSGMQMGEMRVRTPFAPDGTGEMFTAGSMALGVSWGRALTDMFGLGVNVKYIREGYYTLTADGWAIDIGSIYNTGWKNLRIGMAMTNFGPDMGFEGTYQRWYDINEPGRVVDYEEYSLPMAFRFGMAVDLMTNESMNVTLVVDANHPPDNVEVYSLGAEVTMMNMFHARAGYKMGVDEGGLTIGAGVALPIANTAVDVAYSTFGLLGSVTRGSISLAF
jgi:hypothetical protein